MINFLFCCHKANITLPVVNVFSVSSIVKIFHKKDPGPSQAQEESSVSPSTSKETSQGTIEGIVNTEDLPQLPVLVDYPVSRVKL